MKVKILLELTLEAPIPNLVDIVAARAYNIDKVRDVVVLPHEPLVLPVRDMTPPSSAPAQVVAS